MILVSVQDNSLVCRYTLLGANADFLILKSQMVKIPSVLLTIINGSRNIARWQFESGGGYSLKMSLVLNGENFGENVA